ncbi:hypothetical protein [Micromonospora sp. NPDC049102]|uniref:hypothetical protein n=1 Tax=Micromonospora sp. NPDC049102 TaxID=3364265 RepID=UPI00371A48CA
MSDLIERGVSRVCYGRMPLPDGRRGRRIEQVIIDRPQANCALDYHLVLPAPGTGDGKGILVEEFTRQDDFSANGLHSASWTPGFGWWSSASLSRDLRSDPAALARVVPAERAGAADAYRRLGGGDLPSEAALRTYFRDHQPIATAPPLRLGPTQPPDGFHERRVYRVLFARDLRTDQVAALRALWRAAGGGAAGSVADGRRESGGDQFTWELRRVAHTLAWCLDVTVLMRTDAVDAVRATLTDLTNLLRRYGLIVVTTERFS